MELTNSRHPEKQRRLDDIRPRLHAIIIDFTSVAHIDVTGIQTLLITREQLNSYADWNVYSHFVGLSDLWVKRALIYSELGSLNEFHRQVYLLADAYTNDNSEQYENDTNITLLPLLDTKQTFFHIDLDEDYKAALLALSQRT